MTVFDKRNVEDILPLNPLQEGILFHYRKDEQSSLYFIQLTLEIEGEIDNLIFQESWGKVVENNQMLRTIFRWEKLNSPIQIVLRKANLNFQFHDLTKNNISEVEKEFQKIKNLDYAERFDLREIPFRLTLCKLDNNKYNLLISNHHIIYDGWSTGIILKEFFSNYFDYKKEVLNVKPKTKYKEYLKYLRNTKIDSFWGEYLQGLERTQFLTLNIQNKSKKQDNLQVYTSTIPANAVKDILLFCNKNRVSLADLIYTAWGLLLYKYSDNNDIVFGTTVSGRNIPVKGIEDIVGLFINTIPLRIQFNEDSTLSECLNNTSQQQKNRSENENTPLIDIVKSTDFNNDEELIESLIVIENYPLDRDTLKKTDALNVSSFKIKESTNYKLTLGVLLGDEIELHFNYLDTNFEGLSVKKICKDLCFIINSISENKDESLGNLDILTEEEKHQLLYEFNNTKADYPKDKTIHQLFEEQAERTPENVAIRCKGEEISYRDLSVKSSQLANYLLSNASNNKLIAIMSNRSIDMIVGIFGVLKSGHAYLPLDPKQPFDRNNKILQESQTEVIIVDNNDFSFEEIKIVNLRDENIYKENITSVSNIIKSSDLAYVIYTSGSTGVPKGVMISHGNIVNFVTAMSSIVPKDEKGAVLSMTTISFDIFGLELYVPLFKGISMILAKEEESTDVKLLGLIIRNEQVSLLQLTPSRLSLILSDENSTDVFKNIKVVLVGGEELPITLLTALRDIYKGKIYNMYGPTETTIWSTFKDVSKDLSLNIGKPISNTQIYILDNSDKIQPIGLVGELCISGAGLARGYLKNQELTAEKFISHPFKEGERLYRTGDLARWLPDGNIDFLGRIDHQVKIRGFRIELGEIENVILQYKNIKECVVLAREDQGDKYLCAYLVSDKEQNNEDIRIYLSGLLPDYMIPSYFVLIDKIPLTSNGKIDRKSLPVPEIKAGSDYVAPSTELERKLVKIWSEVLNIASQEISTHSSFFELGGHSLKVTLLVSRIHKELDIRLELQDIFQHLTIQSQSYLIKSSSKSSYLSIPKAKDQDYYALSSSQRRLYLLQQMDLDSIAYNMPGVIRLADGISKLNIEEVFNKLISRHENFRTSFELVEELPVQRIASEVSFSISEYKIKKSELDKLREDFIQPFDLSKAPLIRVCYVDVENDHDLLLIDMHHIISDGRSHSILETEFYQLLAGKDLEPLQLQYKDYSEWQNSTEQQSKIKGQESYWLDKFAGELPVLELPTDYPRPVMQNFEGANVNFNLSKEEIANIKVLANSYGLTHYMSVLSVFTILLSKLSGEEDSVIGTPVAGRNHADLENVVGMFVNTLAIRNKVSGHYDLAEYMALLKQSTLNAYSNQDYQFENLVDKVVADRDTSRNPIFDVMFNWLDQEGEKRRFANVNTPLYEHIDGKSKFDLTLTVSDLGDNFLCNFEYCTKLFVPSTIERFVRYLKQIINQISQKQNLCLSEIEIITKEEKQHILNAFNNTKVDYPRQKSIHELFEQQVQKNPNSIAIEDNKESITYDELNQYANKLANILQEKGVKKGDIIPIIMECSSNVVIAILGVLKSGAAYLPIDSLLPLSRILYILNNSKAKHIITKYIYKEELNLKGDVILIDKIDITKGSIKDPEIKCGHEDVAYVIYTSGTTGNPKGTVLKHGGLVNYIYWASQNYIKNGQGNFPLFTSISFDLTITSIFTPLIVGGMIIIYHSEEKEVLIEKIIHENKVNVIKLTPSHLQLIREKEFSSEELLKSNLTGFIVGGENLDTGLAADIYDNFAGKITIYNEYGPTEATVGCMISEFDRSDTSRPSVSIGIPAANMKIYILDKYLKLVPNGVQGEIYVSGIGLSKEYLGNKELTKSKFTPNPYVKGERLYKTGDLALMLKNGQIEFIGRTDSQVKIRGFRIELGEVERSILKYPNIKECTVLVKENKGDKYLCAYTVCKNKFKQSDLRDFLLEFLPEYMVPSYFVELDTLPLTNNGKLNVKELPEIDKFPKSEFAFPENIVEHKILKIWKEVLNLERISVTDSFIMLGGDSIKTIQIVSRALNEGYNINVQDIFKYQTIRELAKAAKENIVQIDQSPVTGKVLLSPIQKFHFTKKGVNFHHFNHALTLTFSVRVEIDLVQSIFEKIIEHHDILRLIFNLNNNEITSEIKNNSQELLVVEYDFSNYSETDEMFREKANIIQSSINLEEGPLLKLGLFHFKTYSKILVVVHHLVIDGVSWRILFEDIDTLYKQYLEKKQFKLPLKTDSFKIWNEKLLEYCTTEKFERSIKYWINALKIPVEGIKRDFIDGSNKLKDIRQEIIILDETQTEHLIKNVNRIYNTNVNEILISGLLWAINDVFGVNKIKIDIEGHGRENINSSENISRTVGWFTSFYPINFNTIVDNNLSKFIKSTKEEIRRVPNNGFDYLIFKYLKPERYYRSIQSESISQIEFNYLGQFDSDITGKSFQVEASKAGDSEDLENNRTYDLNVLGIVKEGKLEINLAYNSKQYKQDTISKLSNSYRHRLEELIDHCLTSKNIESTPSDYQFKDITLKDFDELKERFDFEKIYSLSPMQEGMLFTGLLNPKSTAYLQQITCQFDGSLNIQILEDSFNDLIWDYEILRTTFVSDIAKKPIQLVLKERPIKCICHDLRDEKDSHKKDKTVKQLINKDREVLFDLRNDVLLRLTIIHEDMSKYKLIFTYHHILFDGWCSGILISELFENYSSYINNKPVEKPIINQYSEYIDWINQNDKKESYNFWEENLSSYNKLATIPLPKEKLKSYTLEKEFLSIDLDLMKELKKISEELPITPNAIIQSVWGVLLSKINSTNDVVFGSVVSGRSAEIKGVETIIGLFMNVIPVRIKYDKETTVKELLASTQLYFVQSEPHHYVSLAEIQSRTEIKNNLFDHYIAFENYPTAESLNKEDEPDNENSFNISNVKIFAHTNYDFGLSVIPGDNVITIEFKYNSNVFKSDDICLLVKEYNNLLREFLIGIDRKVSEIECGETIVHRTLIDDGYKASGRSDVEKESLSSWLD